MRIGLNALAFDPGRMGGVETYFRQLLRQLRFDDGGHEYLLVCKNTDSGSLQADHGSIPVKSFPVGRPSLPWLLRRTMFETAHIDILQPFMNRLPVDLLHHPFSTLEPQQLSIPAVLTFWDMQHEFFPEFFSQRELRFRAYAYRASAQKARRVIVSSEFTRDCLVERYGLHPEKIDVIATGYGAEYRPLSDATLRDAIRRYRLPAEFIYYPAALWPHKNHRTLLDALCLLRDRHRIRVHLVLSGMASGRTDELQAAIRSRGLEGSVTSLGYLPYEDLPALYNLATMMVFPSLFEGFGIPLVESMACGCPIACSATTSLPEVAGQAALLFDPHSAEDIAAAIMRVLGDQALRSTLSRAGLERAALFSWQETARKTIVVYEKAFNL